VTIRLFVAVPIDEETRSCVNARVRGFQELLPEHAERQLSWTRSENYHLTIQFLGATEPERIPDILAAMKSACTSITPFQIRLGGLGVFPSSDHVRVVWIGLSKGERPMEQLASILGRELDQAGFVPEERKFFPHLTIARTRPRSRTVRLTEEISQQNALQEEFSDDTNVSELVLYESISGCYLERARFPLIGAT